MVQMSDTIKIVHYDHAFVRVECEYHIAMQISDYFRFRPPAYQLGVVAVVVHDVAEQVGTGLDFGLQIKEGDVPLFWSPLPCSVRTPLSGYY